MTTFFIIIVFVFLLVLNYRLNKLEVAMRGRQEIAPAQHAAAEAFIIHGQVGEVSERMPTQERPPQNNQPPTGDAFTAWVKEDWLLKLGAFIVLLGIGWFLSYAFAQNWIGPTGRVTIGMFVGVGLLGFGWARMHLYERQGSVFLGLGAMVIIISAFSAAYAYALISGHAALGIMFLTSAFIALASVRFKVHSLAVVSIIIASIAPSMLLIHSTATSMELFAYLFVIVIGTIWIVSLTGWRNLTAVALVMFFLYSIPHLGGATAETSSLLVFAYAFALLFFVTNTVGILKIREGDIYPDSVTAAANGLLLLAWINAGASVEWKSLIMVGWMVVFTIAAFAVYAVTKRKEPFFVYAGVGIGMLAAATAIDFHGAGLTIAYTIESAIVPLVVYGVMRNRHVAQGLLVLLFGPVVLSLGSIFANWHSAIPFDHFFVLLILSFTMFLLGVFFWSIPKEEGEVSSVDKLVIGGSVYAYILLWLSIHATIAASDTATMICLVIYTIIGLITYAYGRMNENKAVHYYGGVLLAFTIGHLLLIDVWNMALTGRIITFLLVGALLMGTAFMSRKK